MLNTLPHRITSLPGVHLLLLLLLLAGCGLTGCAPGDDAQRAGTLVVAWPADADALNPVVQQSQLGQYICALLFPNPITERFEDCRLQLVPYLAESWEHGADGKSLTITLRPDVSWEDGTPVTATDLAFTAELFGDPQVASPRQNQLELVERVEVLDSRTVTYHFSTAFDPEAQLNFVSQDVVPRHLLESADRQSLRSDPFNERPVGAGPFRLEHWLRNQEIALVANPACTLTEAPRLERVVFRIIPEYTTRLTELISGGVDMMDGLQMEDVARLERENPEIRVLPSGWRFVEYVGWNLRDPLFAEREVRRALTMSIDRETLMKVLLTAGDQLYGRPAIGTITPEMCRAYNDRIEPLPYDPQAAKRLLAGQGWTDSDRDGYLDRRGEKFSIALKTGAGNPRREKAAVLIQSQLREVGVEVRIEQLEGVVLYQQLRQKEFQATLAGWQASLYIDPSTYWHSGEEYPFNFCSYENPEVDRLIDAGLIETDQDRAQEIWYEVQRLVYEDQPYTFLYWTTSLRAIHRRFQDVGANILTPLYNLEHWWEDPAWAGRESRLPVPEGE